MYLDRKNFAYVGGLADTSTDQERLKGFRDGLAEAGHRLELAIGREYTYEWGARRPGASTQKGPEIDAIFFANDIIALP